MARRGKKERKEGKKVREEGKKERRVYKAIGVQSFVTVSYSYIHCYGKNEGVR